MSNIIALVSQYELLGLTASYLSALDLLHLASTCSGVYSYIRNEEAIFERLKRVTVCDGRGLKERQEYRGFFFIPQDCYKWSRKYRRPPSYDEELEVRVWNLKCDGANALPCLKCGVNVCEECRYVPRVRDGYYFNSCRKPYLDPTLSTHTILCYCKQCDQDIERTLPLRLSELCDCDQYTRWICIRCRTKERTEDGEYIRTRTKSEYEYPTEGDDGVRDDGMWLVSHQEERAFWCPCGNRSPSDGNIRCLWCLRRHNRETFMTVAEDLTHSIPFFDDNPCHPKIKREPWPGGIQIMYPYLGYTGPIAP